MAGRAAHTAEVVVELDVSFAKRPLSEWRGPLDDARIPWGPFQTLDELLADPQVVANGYIGTVEREGAESVPAPRGSGAVRRAGRPAAPAPRIWASTPTRSSAEVGYSWDEIVALKLNGAVL